MPIRFTYHERRKMLVTSAEGLVSFEDIQKHLDEEIAARALGYRELFDASDASTNLTASQIRTIAGRLLALTRSNPFGPTAVITWDDMFFGMVRMLQIICELQGGPRISVFRTRDQGMAWLEASDGNEEAGKDATGSFR